MSTRTIIAIDEEKCNGCGLCIPNCPEGALQVIDGKARLVSDLFCDGLGACVGHCPEGAITLLEREAEPYDERKVMANIARQGANTVRAHLAHLEGHGETELLKEARDYLKEHDMPAPLEAVHEAPAGCPGRQSVAFPGTQRARGSRSPRWDPPSWGTGPSSFTFFRPWRRNSKEKTFF